ncbi:MAG: hypothetical protein AAF401_13955 [Pseudomonadota bacterium]
MSAKQSKPHRAARAVIHIGAPKAGSTSLQTALSEGRARLSKTGVLYPRSLGDIAHNRLAAAVGPLLRRDSLRRDQRIRGPLSVRRLRKALEAALAREMEEARPETLLISSEHFYADATTVGEIVRLRSFALRFADRVRIVVYLRRQDEAIYSAWLHGLRVGAAADFTPPTSIRTGDRHDYAARLALWRRVFPREDIIARPFEEATLQRGPATDFLRLAGVRTTLKRRPAENVALDRVRAEFMRRFNQLAPRCIEGEPNPLRGDIDLAIDEAPSIAARPGLREEDAAAIMRLYERSNRKLAEEWGENGDFFSDRPPHLGDSLSALEIDDVVGIAAHLWAHKQKRLMKLKRKVKRMKAEQRRDAVAASA